MIAQTCIALFGFLAIWLNYAKTARRRRWAPVFGLIGQPFWMYATWSSQLWGVLLLTVIYTIAWMRGVYVHWVSPQREIP